MKLIRSLALLLLAIPAAAVSGYMSGPTINTTTGKVTQTWAGVLNVSNSSATINTPTIVLNGAGTIVSTGSISGNNGLIADGTLGAVAFGAPGAQEEIRNSFTGTGHSELNIFQMQTPGLSVGAGGEEGTVNYMGRDSSSVNKQMGSLSYVWYSASASTGMAVARLSSNDLGGTRETTALRIFGGGYGGVSLCGTSGVVGDMQPPGAQTFEDGCYTIFDDSVNVKGAGGISNTYGITTTTMTVFGSMQISGVVGTGLLTVNYGILAGTVAVNNGYIQSWSQTITQLQASTPTAVGQQYYCSNCSPAKLVVSTGTALGNFADAVGGAFK